MPGEPIGRNVVCMDLEAQIVAALNVELIYSHEDLGHLRKQQLFRSDVPMVAKQEALTFQKSNGTLTWALFSS